MTSVSQSDDRLRLSHWREAGLLKQTWIKPMMATVSQSLVSRVLGTLHDEDYPHVREVLTSMVVPSFWPMGMGAGQ